MVCKKVISAKFEFSLKEKGGGWKIKMERNGEGRNREITDNKEKGDQTT